MPQIIANNDNLGGGPGGKTRKLDSKSISTMIQVPVCDVRRVRAPEVGGDEISTL